MTLLAGTVVTLQVAKELSPYGYFLTDGREEVLLHYSETAGPGSVEIGQEVEVFLFFDTKDRLAATMKKPLIHLGEVALLEVVDLHERFGSFLDMGLGRNLLLPYKDQPELETLRPKVGDKVYVTLSHDKQGRLLAKMAGERELAPLCFQAPSTWKNTWIDARVYRTLEENTFVICGTGVLGFGAIGMIHSSERPHLLRVGEAVQVRVVHVREDGRVNLSMRQPKQIGRDEDAETIISFLLTRPDGAMPYSDATPADVILSRFGISKAAFKRALGKLMKEGRVEQKESWTYLKNGDEAGNQAPEGH